MPETDVPEGPPPSGFGDPGSADVEPGEVAESSSRSPLKALLHTEPDERPGQQPGDQALGHAIVGSKKVAHYLSEGDMGEGTPALLNFVMALKLTLEDRDGDTNDADPVTDGEANPELPESQADIADLEEIDA